MAQIYGIIRIGDRLMRKKCVEGLLVAENKKRICLYDISFIFLSLLSDSNQRPRDYKSRALAN